ncbi:MAG: hypothetical protein A2W93_05140 [Bacteroidetes bacterium GWF2_43_63]|nr:MAG: hypothetical protein A2W93_05140 [Bacteroidetes bacterium GWF2_43_63]HBG71937.1 hypothetical protein [Bacteroidales bacterium]
MIKIAIVCFAALLLALNAGAQDLPKGMTEEEKAMMPFYKFPQMRSSITTPPTWTPRAMAEWEEIDVLLITWTSYTSVLRQIVDAAQEECTVLIACNSLDGVDSTQVKSYLTSGGVPLTNVKFLTARFNSVWIRDYGAHTIYQNEVGNNYLVDWEYNRSFRPSDDTMAIKHAAWAGLDLYSMTVSPWDFIATGGNLMVDGFGTAMSSELIVDENPSHSVAEIDTIMKHFLGIDQYVLFPTLPYDGIHHIDMHMKLLDEETILVGQYPSGISDGPQIEANLQWLLSNYMSCYGTPYKVVRIPMPSSTSGGWPSSGSYYRTYTNGVFVNKAYIYPSYYEEYDTTAFRIYSEALPGYTIVPIDCDPDPISASGAIHCITNCIGSNDPLLISHQPLASTQSGSNDYQVNAYIKHESGIAAANVYYKTSLAGSYVSVPMSSTGSDNWTGHIPVQPDGSTVYYYVQAQAVSGKTQVRPMPAPAGYWEFNCQNYVGMEEQFASVGMESIYPNPAAYLTCIPVECGNGFTGRLSMIDATGRTVNVIHEGEFAAGKNNYFFNAIGFESGLYIIQLESEESVQQQKVIVRNF